MWNCPQQKNSAGLKSHDSPFILPLVSFYARKLTIRVFLRLNNMLILRWIKNMLAFKSLKKITKNPTDENNKFICVYFAGFTISSMQKQYYAIPGDAKRKCQ